MEQKMENQQLKKGKMKKIELFVKACFCCSQLRIGPRQ